MSDEVVSELSYEQALELLDQRLLELEEGELSLDAALSRVDEARDYLRICQARLSEAKQRIEVSAEIDPIEPAKEPLADAQTDLLV